MKLNYFNCLRFLRWSLLSLFLVVSAGQAKVYSNIQIAAYGEDRSFHLEQCQSKTFLNFMEELVYPAIKGDAVNRTGGEHIDAVKEGEGIEIRLTDNVSTYHVKYKAAEEENSERAGRSFAAVGFKKKGTVAKYLADASDSYYLSSLEEVGGDADQLRL
ncbi:MAG: hypothetical protein HYR96_15070, partial [Deltaproteobacteria bacterium]|nr:hypothetical protein [Deltaproteobacteria bacterium]